MFLRSQRLREESVERSGEYGTENDVFAFEDVSETLVYEALLEIDETERSGDVSPTPMR